MPSPAIDRLIDTLRRAMYGGSWHGPSLDEVLDGLDASDAAMHPIAGAHSAWELVLHLTAWTREAARRVQGAAPREPAEGDWPAVPANDGAARERAWDDARAALVDAHAALLDAVAALDPARLDDRNGAVDDTSLPPGERTTLHGMLEGVAQHDAYHGGQIVLLRRALAARGV